MAKHRREQQEAAAILDSKHRLRERQGFPEATRAEIEAQKRTAVERQRLEQQDSE